MNSADTLIHGITARQHGTATRAQLLAAGVSRDVIDARVRSGRLARVHHGVYRVATQEPTIWTRAAAAVLATSPPRFDAPAAHVGATESVAAPAVRSRAASPALPPDSRPTRVAISHVGAALLWGCPGWDPPDLFDISGAAPRRVPGVRVHRVRTLGDDEVTRLRGVPVTTPARTVLDIAGIGTARELEQALAAAERGSSGCRGQIRLLLHRHPKHAGSGLLRQLLDLLDASGEAPLFLRSGAEELALRLCRRGGLPGPLANVRIAGLEVDFAWPEPGVIMEVDGYEFHGSAAAFHRDRERDRTLAAAGYQVLRFTWRQLTEEPEASLVALCTSLNGRRSPTAAGAAPRLF